MLLLMQLLLFLLLLMLLLLLLLVLLLLLLLLLLGMLLLWVLVLLLWLLLVDIGLIDLTRLLFGFSLDNVSRRPGDEAQVLHEVLPHSDLGRNFGICSSQLQRLRREDG